MSKKACIFLGLTIFSIFFLPLASPVSATFTLPTFLEVVIFSIFRLAASFYVFLLPFKYLLRYRKNWWLVINIIPAVLIPSFLVFFTRLIGEGVDFVAFFTILCALLLAVTLPFIILDYILRFGRTGKIIVATIIIVILIVSNTGLALSIKSTIDERRQTTNN